ncbi:unnamed protein product [Alternaria alternata]
MFSKNTAALLVVALMPLTNAYRLTFYAGFDCNGERLESRQAIQDGTCYDPEYLGASTNSITIVQEEDDDPNSIVVFFPRGTVKTSVVLFEKTFSPNLTLVKPVMGWALLMATSSRWTAELWRWNQIALDTFSGVKPEDWSSQVRIANFAPLEAGRDYPFNYTEYDLIHNPQRLAERAVAESNFSPNYDVEASGLVKRQDSAAGSAAKPSVQSFWSFLQKPFISGPIVTLGGGYIGSRYFPSCPSCVPDCATNEREGVRTTLNEGTTPGLPASALSSDIIDGSSTIGTLTAIITPPTQRMNGICNTPVANGARGQFALSRHMLPLIRRGRRESPAPGVFVLSHHEHALYANVPGFKE